MIRECYLNKQQNPILAAGHEVWASSSKSYMIKRHAAVTVASKTSLSASMHMHEQSLPTSSSWDLHTIVGNFRMAL